MKHDHENNCPPKLQNTIWWVAPLLPILAVACLFVDKETWKRVNRTNKDGTINWGKR